MSDCDFCKIEAECHYPYKPCDCVRYRKFWDAERRKKHDNGVESDSSLCVDMEDS